MEVNRIVLILAGLYVPMALASNLDLGRGKLSDVLYVHHAPDPVNVRTGNFYLPLQDYYRPCFNMPIEVYRSYNSFWTQSGPFGKGWTFNFDAQIAVNEQVGLQVIEADGFITSYQPKEGASGPGLFDKLLAAKKSEDQSRKTNRSAGFYEDYREKIATDVEFLKKQKALYLSRETVFSPSGKYVSKERGTSTLEETKDAYIRVMETGRKEVFNKKGKLVRVEDRNQNVLRFLYDGESRLSKITDGCDQTLSFKFNKLGMIEKLFDHTGQSVAYTYDNGGYLVGVKTVDNQNIKFKYDEQGKMSSIVFPDGSETKILYDAKTSRVTKQIGPGTKVTTYAYGKDSSKSWTTIEDTQGEKSRYEYFDGEHKTVHTDRNGKKTVTVHMACCGKPLSIKDESGKGDTFKYDAEGNLTARTNALNQTTTFKYDPRFNMPSEIVDASGKSIRYVYDQNGNMTFSKTSTGEHVKISYEPHGKITSIIDHTDSEIMFTYDKYGNPALIEKLLKKRKTAKLTIAYGPNMEVASIVPDPAGKETVASIKSTITSLFDYLKPIGIDFAL